MDTSPRNASASQPVVAACLKLLSCGEFPHDGFFTPYRGVSECTWRNTASISYPHAIVTDLGTVTSAACLAGSHNCADVTKCVTGGIGIDCTTYPRGTCVGPVVAYCPPTPRTIGRDCSLGQPGDDANSMCFIGTNGVATCGINTCTATPSVACEGNTAVTCEDGVRHRRTCPLGSVCVSGATGGACGGSGAPCTDQPSQFVRCEGDTSVLCVDARELRVSCAELPIRSICSPSTNAAFTMQCVPSAGLACDPTQHNDRCDGSRLVYCDGNEREIDCSLLGFGTCTSTSGFAACTT